MKRTKSFHKSLMKGLKDPREASEYLNAVIKEGDINLFMAAIRDVAQAQGGMVKLARQANLNRGNLYKMLSKKGNPGIQTVENVLKVFGLRLAIIPDETNHLQRAA